MRREWPERLSLLLADEMAFAAGLVMAAWLLRRLAGAEAATMVQLTPDAMSTLLVAKLVTMTCTFFLRQMYHQPRGVALIDLLFRLFTAVSIGVITTYALVGLLLVELDYPRILPVYDWLTTLLAVVTLRGIHRTAWGALRQHGFGRHRMLIVGAGTAGQDLVARVQRRPRLGYEVVGFVDDTPGRTRARGLPVVGRTSQLGELVDALAIDELLIALPKATRQELLALVSQCHREGLAIRVFPDVFQIMASEVQISDLDGLPLLMMRDVALRGWRRVLKRLVDIAISVTALVILSPLLLAVAILVKLESAGPAFYIQERVGLDARPFPIIKFRSMSQDAEDATGAVWARRDDPRRTRLGNLLRKYNIDEFPQLINVLLGHMSIVGPRPERPEFVAEFEVQIPRYTERHRERAGITGWAQVNGLRGDTSIEERTKYDLYYIENWSLLFDFKIMARTFLSSFRDPNAY
ncbi:MAG: undecaprenyl-phosphate glucose phosphotransferase [Anaerolineae bacterium]